MPRKHNLVFLLSDRQRFDTLRCYGNDWIQVPNLNALADQSFVFENAYVTQAVCAPARASIMTGLNPHSAGMPRNGLAMPEAVKTIAEMLPGDYRKAYIGKWHLGDELSPQHGFDEWVSSIEPVRDERTDSADLARYSDYHRFLLDQGIEPDQDVLGGRVFSGELRMRLPAGLQMASFVGDRAADFIVCNSGRPFVLYASCVEPHPPYFGPYDHLYDPDQLPVGPTFLLRPDEHSYFSRIRSDFFMQCFYDGHDFSTEAGWRRARASYMSNVKLVDYMVGKVVDAIDRAGVADNTILAFTSEHGELIGNHAMAEMRTFYEESAKVPLLVRVPWLSRKQRMIGGNFGQIDLVPTLLDLMGEPIPDHLEGSSRAAVLRGEATLDGKEVYMEHNGIGDRDLTSEASAPTFPPDQAEILNTLKTLPWRSIVTADRWKLNLCVGDQCELFDLGADPFEQHNLFNEPAYKDRIRQMTSRIRLWQHRTGDTAPLPAV